MNNIFKNYIEYYKDNPKGYWFKRKLYGWGWIPVKWEGWLTLLIYVAGLIFIAKSIDIVQNSVSYTLLNFAPRFIALSVIFIFICYKTGEKPKWQWGRENQ